MNLKETLDALKETGKFVDDESIYHHVMSRMHDLSSRLLVGNQILEKKNNGLIKLKDYKSISDDDFTVLVFDFYISDKIMSKIFGVSDSTISRRRNKLGILRNNSEDQYQTYQWILSERIAPNVDAFVKTISV